MAYILYSSIVFMLVFCTALYLTRSTWTPFLASIPSPTFPSLPDSINNILPSSLGRYTRLSTFQDDMEAGLSSATFDLGENIGSGDGRAGLDDAGKREVQRIMKSKRVNFDEARRLWVEERFRSNGIGADGRPRDPKFVSFS